MQIKHKIKNVSSETIYFDTESEVCSNVREICPKVANRSRFREFFFPVDWNWILKGATKGSIGIAPTYIKISPIHVLNLQFRGIVIFIVAAIHGLSKSYTCNATFVKNYFDFFHPIILKKDQKEAKGKGRKPRRHVSALNVEE